MELPHHMGPPLIPWINFNPSTDKQLHPFQSVGSNHLSIPKPQRCRSRSLGMDNYFHPPPPPPTCDYLSTLAFRRTITRCYH